MIIHPIPPVWNGDSKVLILGSFPSVKSRETSFFYGHPQNRFWRVLAAVTDSPVPATVPEKRAFLLSNGVAVWDVIASCDIAGSADSSIKNVTPNDLTKIITGANIRQIFTNGQTAHKLYRKYIYPSIVREDICLSSTSPANAAWTEKMLAEAWQTVAEYLNQ